MLHSTVRGDFYALRDPALGHGGRTTTMRTTFAIAVVGLIVAAISGTCRSAPIAPVAPSLADDAANLTKVWWGDCSRDRGGRVRCRRCWYGAGGRVHCSWLTRLTQANPPRKTPTLSYAKRCHDPLKTSWKLYLTRDATGCRRSRYQRNRRILDVAPHWCSRVLCEERGGIERAAMVSTTPKLSQPSSSPNFASRALQATPSPCRWCLGRLHCWVV